MTHPDLTPKQIERFWSKIDRSGGPDACWPWMAGRFPSGYGATAMYRVPYRAHRLAFILTVGPIPARMVICHMCDNPPCCNPRHLWLGTVADNNRDTAAKGHYPTGDQHPARLNPDLRRGERNGRSRLKNDDIRDIRRRYAAGESQGDIAERYRVHRNTIWWIVNRRHWKHVE